MAIDQVLPEETYQDPKNRNDLPWPDALEKATERVANYMEGDIILLIMLLAQINRQKSSSMQRCRKKESCQASSRLGFRSGQTGNLERKKERNGKLRPFPIFNWYGYHPTNGQPLLSATSVLYYVGNIGSHHFYLESWSFQ